MGVLLAELEHGLRPGLVPLDVGGLSSVMGPFQDKDVAAHRISRGRLERRRSPPLNTF